MRSTFIINYLYIKFSTKFDSE